MAHWKLDEGSGTTVVDATGNGHDGTIEGDPQWVVGYFGEALQFAGSPDRVVVPDSAQLNPEGALTFSLWANVDSSSLRRDELKVRSRRISILIIDIAL